MWRYGRCLSPSSKQVADKRPPDGLRVVGSDVAGHGPGHTAETRLRRVLSGQRSRYRFLEHRPGSGERPARPAGALGALDTGDIEQGEEKTCPTAIWGQAEHMSLHTVRQAYGCNVAERRISRYTRGRGTRWLSRLAGIGLGIPVYLLLILVLWTTPALAQEISFDDGDPDLMVLSNGAFYEIAFRKTNGAIAYILDKHTGRKVSLGSRYECLWGAVFPDASPDYVGGCSFRADGPNRFDYTWVPDTHTLILRYTPDPSAPRQVGAQVLVVASAEPWFDMRLSLDNRWGAVLDYVLFPSDLVFPESEIREALLPILPGVVLNPAFFRQGRTYTARYPGYPGLFADYVSLATTGGRMAIYTRNPEGTVRPVVMGFVHDDAYLADSTFFYHTFGARIQDGASFETPWVRIHVGRGHMDTIRAYRSDNGLDRFRSLADKLGDKYDQVVHAPLYKADAVQLAIPFSAYPSLLEQVPGPGILHPVAFQPGGHDQNYPDFLPPDPAWGTTADFAAMVRRAQSLGFLVMPYTNPTWWDDESPTLRSLGPTTPISHVAVLDEQGVPVYEYYGPHGGYVVSPHAPFVQDRLARLAISITVDLPTDLLFEDQIGARPWLFDHNPFAPHPVSYVDGWVAHTRAYSDTLLMTELGFDRLAETEVGFHGSVLLPERLGYIADWWGADTWHPYPLATAMLRDKVLFYQHDLAPETFTSGKATLTWNLALGFMLSYDLVASSFGGGLDSPWLDVVSAFQSRVLGRYAGELVTGFDNLADGVTRTRFETHTVIANRNEGEAYIVGDHTLPPQGVLVTSADGTLTAGIFTRFYGLSLTPGDHYLIAERERGAVRVAQPMGADTPLVIPLPNDGRSGAPEVWAYDRYGRLIGRVPSTETEDGVGFAYVGQIEGRPVAFYRVLRPYRSFLPVVRGTGEEARLGRRFGRMATAGVLVGSPEPTVTLGDVMSSKISGRSLAGFGGRPDNMHAQDEDRFAVVSEDLFRSGASLHLGDVLYPLLSFEIWVLCPQLCCICPRRGQHHAVRHGQLLHHRQPCCLQCDLDG